MIELDHRFTSIAAASALALGALLSSPSIARASLDVPAAAAPAAVEALSAPNPPSSDVDVSLSCDGRYSVVSTKSQTVGEFLVARGIHVAEDDFVSVPLDSPLTDGIDIAYRSSKIVTILDGAHRRTLHTNAATIAEVLHDAGFNIGRHDLVVPSPKEAPLPSDVIRVERYAAWTEHKRTTIAQTVRTRSASDLAAGRTRTIDPGAPGIREITTRVVRVPSGSVSRTVLASRIIRMPRARIVERGVEYATLASAAERGFSSALHFAGTAIHMIATAYTATCYKCSGITASGVPAGFGVIAVDPNIIPLGTKLFIPGYGRAVAGDTGGAIRGHRIDLGMNTVAQALRFGRRPMTVYVLR